MGRMGRYFVAGQPLHVIQRGNDRQGYTERFCYDDMNRLTRYNLGGGCEGGKAVSYNTIGNIITKSCRTYTYASSPMRCPLSRARSMG